MREPGGCSLIGSSIPFRNGREAGSDHVRINEVGGDQCIDEILVLLAEGAELCDAQVFLVQALSDEPWLAREGGGVLVLYLHQSSTPPVG